jgi:hypothetical protein
VERYDKSVRKAYQHVDDLAARSCRLGGDGEDEKGAVVFAGGGCDGEEDDGEWFDGDG